MSDHDPELIERLVDALRAAEKQHSFLALPDERLCEPGEVSLLRAEVKRLHDQEWGRVPADIEALGLRAEVERLRGERADLVKGFSDTLDREIPQHQREAFIAGADWVAPGVSRILGTYERAVAEAASRYPDPAPDASPAPRSRDNAPGVVSREGSAGDDAVGGDR